MKKFLTFRKGKKIEKVNKDDFYYELFTKYPDALFLLDFNGDFIDANQGLEALTGFTRDKLLYSNFSHYIYSEDLADVKSYFNEALKGNVQEKEFRIVQKGEKIRCVTITATPAIVEGDIVGVYGVAKDITDKKYLEDVVKNNETRFESLIQNSTDVIGILEQDGTIRYQSPAVKHVLGYDQKQMEGTNCFDYIFNEDLEIAENLFSTILNNPRTTSKAEFRLKTADGKLIHCEANVINLVDDKNVNGIVVNYRDITERKMYEQEIKHMACHDYLTGLPNRYMLEKRLSSEMEKSSSNKKKLAVFFIDLDRFKVINDSMGHSVGDLLLQEVAKRLKSSIREKDILFRQGGDEFIVILADVDRKIASKVAERMLKALSNPFSINNYDIYTSSSIGISLFPEDGKTVEQLIKHADFAMYQAKKNGCNSYHYFSSDKLDENMNPLKMEIELHKALERNQLSLHYQPKINLKTGKIIGVEALIRWNHPVWGMVSPGTFIPIAEESGLIIPLGEWALQAACIQTRLWKKKGFLTVVSVNLSPRQFTQTNLVNTIRKILGKTGLEPHLLEIEITESMTIDIGRTTSTLQQLKKLGVRISIDDFGTGFSSLNYLKQFPVDTLKIDQSFVRELHNNPNDETIVKTIISMAHNLNLNIVAEGIETIEQLVFLQKHLCDEGQGFFFSKPLPAEELEGRLQEIQETVKKFGISQDMNERMWAEELVLSARKELQDTIRLQQGMIMKFKKINGCFIHTLCDGELLYRFGIIPNQVIGKELRDFLSEAVSSEKELYYERAWNGEEHVSYEAQVNGIQYLSMLRPVRRGGEVVEVIGSCIDITERKKAEEALLESEKKYRLIAENMTDLIGIVDIKGNVLYASPSYEGILGYDLQSCIGKNVVGHLHPEDIPVVQDNFNYMVQNKTPFQIEFRYLHRNGGWVLIESSGTPIIGENGQVEQVVIVGRDISERRKAEELLWKSEKLSVVGELAAGIAHEIRNPITSIKGFIQLFQQGTIKQDYFDVIFAEFNRIEEIIKELLTLAKPQAIKLRVVDVNTLLKDVERLLESEANLRNVQIFKEIEENIRHIKCDPNQVKQVIINLVKNSIEAISSGGQIKINVSTEGSNLVIQVIDNGVGISEDRLPKLGEPFFSNKEKGTGLGLMLCFRIIREHKGTITIKSEENIGTTVEVKLPNLLDGF